MAFPTNTFSTYTAIGNREDLSDIIYRIDPTDTPFLSGCETERAMAVNHEWQTQSLATASGANAQLEGDDVTADSTTATVRLGNICQISRKSPRVTGTQRAVEHAGRDDEMAYQEMLKGLELKRDMESVLMGGPASGGVGSVAKNTGNATTARKLANVTSWIKTNTSKGGSGADPSAADGTGTRTDGTQRTFKEADLKTVLNSIWGAGGKPDTIMVGAFNKQVFSTFTGRATQIEDTKARKIIAAVDAYESDFGRLNIVPNRFMRAREALVLQLDMWAVAYLNGRKMLSIPLAKTGDSDLKTLISEYTLVARNEASGGGVFDLTTS
jgi:hypothetical protein